MFNSNAVFQCIQEDIYSTSSNQGTIFLNVNVSEIGVYLTIDGIIIISLALVYIFAWFFFFILSDRIMIDSMTEIILDLMKYDVAFNPNNIMSECAYLCIMWACCQWKSGSQESIPRIHAREILVWRDLFGLKLKLLPGFPMSHFPLPCHGRSPTVSSARTKQKPVSRVPASY